MRKIFLIFLIIFVLNIENVMSSGYLRMSNLECYPTGAIKFKINYAVEDVSSPSTGGIKISANSSKINLFEVKGDFYDSTGNSIRKIGDYGGYFISEGGQFNSGVDYSILLWTKKEGVMNDSGTVNCPGFRYKCEDLNLKIHRCYEQKAYKVCSKELWFRCLQRMGLRNM